MTRSHMLDKKLLLSLVFCASIFWLGMPIGWAQIQLPPVQTNRSQAATPDAIESAPGTASAHLGSPYLTMETGGFSSEIRAIAFSAGGEIVAASSDSDIRIWDIATGELVHTIRGFSSKESGKITSIAADPAGEYLAIAVQTSQGAYLRTCHLDELDTTGGYWGDPAMIKDEPLTGVSLGPRSARELTFSSDGKYLGFVATILEVNDSGNAESKSQFLFFDWQQDQLVHSFDVPPVPEGVVGHTLFGTQRLVQAGRFLGTDRYYVMPNLGTILDVETQTNVSVDASPDLLWLSRLFPKLWTYYQQRSQPQGYMDGDLHHRTMAFAYMSKLNGHDVYQCDVWHDEANQPNVVYEGLRWAPSELKVSHDAQMVGVGDVLGNVHVFSAITGETLFRTQSIVQPLYAASLDQEASVLALGSRPHRGSEWKLNDYADLDRGFHLQQRLFVTQPRGNFPRPETAITSLGVDSESAKVDAGSFVRVSGVDTVPYLSQPIQKPFFSWTMAPGEIDEELFLLRGGSGYLVADLIQLGPLTSRFGQQQRGLMSAVASPEKSSVAADVNVTADGQFVTAAWTDGTACIYRKKDFLPQAFAAFPFTGTPIDLHTVRIDQITDTDAAGQLQVGDLVHSIDEKSVMEFLQLLFSAPETLQVGSVMQAELTSDGQAKQVPFRLVEAAANFTTATVSPVLTFFATKKDDWILYTPQGYYDASLGGHDLIGWKVNRGPDETSTFFSARQLRKSLYRPDIVDQVIEAIVSGDSDAAVVTSLAENAEPQPATIAGIAAGPPEPTLLDLRTSESFSSILPPVVSISGLPEDGQTQAGTVTLQVEADTQNELPVRSIVVLVNGRPPVGAPPQQSPTDDNGMIVEQTIELAAGKNEIAVIAVNAAASSTPEVFTVTRSVTQAAPTLMPQLYVLSVGVSEYKNSEYDLKYAAKDANAFANTFETQKDRFYREVQTKVLTDQQATRSKIQDAMDWLMSSVTQHDLAIIFISGHGVFDSRRNYYFCPYEVDADRLRSTALANSEIERLVEELPCKVMLFVDTCHSGSSRGAKSINSDPWTDLVADEVGAILFASSTPQEISLESDEWGHGAFALAFLDSMKRKDADVNSDGYLSINELDLSLSERVKELTGGRQHATTQKPSTIRNFNFAVSGSE